ncbi:MAG: hypothetical protein CMI27_03705 [Opitutae bacterium]|nr:hypothetical protein [Opitutae bacterium]|tara:strand:+ start:706 stop:963 length:258 start_codon:yes stop_codon:yes gene_type:complete
MKEVMLGAAIFLSLSTLVMWVFASSRAVEKARIQEMAHKLYLRPNFELLEIKELLIGGYYELDEYEINERIEAINIALNAKQRAM